MRLEHLIQGRPCNWELLYAKSNRNSPRSLLPNTTYRLRAEVGNIGSRTALLSPGFFRSLLDSDLAGSPATTAQKVRPAVLLYRNDSRDPDRHYR